MTISRLSPAGRRPLRVGGAVVQALLEELGGGTDPWRELRSWADEHRVSEAALCGFERIADVGQLDGDERYGFFIACLLVEEALQRGSSAVRVGAAPGFADLMAHLDDVRLPADRPRLARGLTGLFERCATMPEEERVLGRGDESRPLVVDGGALYFHYLRAAEARVAADLGDLLDDGASAPWSAADVAGALSAVLDERPLHVGGEPMALAGEQIHAIAHALSSSLLVLTGGPGTGKTSVVTSLLRAFAHLGVAPEDMSLAAPTGRAANRMKESVEASLAPLVTALPSDEALRAHLPSARTLHRLLGYSWHRQTFKVNRESPLSGRVLVVDEVSMVSLPLMGALLSAVPRDRPFTLVLVGDAHQLPSVETGDVLRELTRGERGIAARRRALLEAVVEALPDGQPRGSLRGALAQPSVESTSLAAHTVWLRHVFRQAADVGGQQIARVAEVIRTADQEAPALDVTARDDARALSFAGVEHFDWTTAPGGLDALLARYADTFLRDDAWRRHHEEGFAAEAPELVEYVRERGRTRVLCLTHKGVTGEEAVNAALSLRLESTRPPASFAFAGAPVLVTENDDGVGLFNGDQGVVVRVRVPDGEPRLEAAFPSGAGVTLVPLGRLPKAKLCYAMTVHKSQGSEYDHVLLLLPDEDGPLLVRETVYTGLTRAKRGVVLAGARERLDAAVAKRTVRTSRLRERLAAPSATGSRRPPARAARAKAATERETIDE